MKLRVQGARPLVGSVRVPGDLHIGQQALLWAALSEGDCLIAGLSKRPDHALLIAALREMGVPMADTPQGLRVRGVGLRGLAMPRGALHARESVTTLEILSALLSAQWFGTRIEASGAALGHSLRTLITPLRARGANIMGKATDDGELRAPVSVAPMLRDESLAEVEIAIPDGDPATKLALLVSGLFTRGITAIQEGMLSRDHVERALVALGVEVQTLGGMTLLDTSASASRWPGFSWEIPGDFALASFVMAAALAVPGSDIRLENVGVNATRSALFDALRHAGARIDVLPKGDLAGNEPVADIRVRTSRLRGIRVGGELAFRLLDDVLALSALGPAMGGRLYVRDMASLRTRSPDPLKAMAQLARSVGMECTDYADGFDLDPASSLRAVRLAEDASPELMLLGLVWALASAEESVLPAAEQLDALYPGIVDSLVALGASIAEEPAP